MALLPWRIINGMPLVSFPTMAHRPRHASCFLSFRSRGLGLAFPSSCGACLRAFSITDQVPCLSFLAKAKGKDNGKASGKVKVARKRPPAAAAEPTKGSKERRL